jgi:hypothetical protein
MIQIFLPTLLKSVAVSVAASVIKDKITNK